MATPVSPDDFRMVRECWERASAERARAVELLRQCLPALQGDEPEVIAASNAVGDFLSSLDASKEQP